MATPKESSNRYQPIGYDYEIDWRFNRVRHIRSNDLIVLT